MAKMSEILYSLGQSDARDLRARAKDMDGTSIIREEHKIPRWRADRDYSNHPVGSPARHEGQVYKLIQPHNAANYGGTPATLPALWSIFHTKDPSRAKAWKDPDGISGLWMQGECYRDDAGQVHRCKADGTIYNAEALPSAWDTVKEE